MSSDCCSLVLIAQSVVFLLERGQADRQTDATERPTHAGGYAGVGKYKVSSNEQNKRVYIVQHQKCICRTNDKAR